MANLRRKRLIRSQEGESSSASALIQARSPQVPAAGVGEIAKRIDPLAVDDRRQIAKGLRRLGNRINDCTNNGFGVAHNGGSGEHAHPGDHRIEADEIADLSPIAGQRLGIEPRRVLNERLVELLPTRPMLDEHLRARLCVWRHPGRDQRG